MTIRLSEDLSDFVREKVKSGRYDSVDEVVRDALERLRIQIAGSGSGRGSLGAMSDAADELDEVVVQAMSLRERPWRKSRGE